MIQNLYNSIPRTWLVGEWLLDWNANDTNDWTKNNGASTNVTYTNTERWYQKQIWSFNGSSSNINWIWSVDFRWWNFTISQWIKYNNITTWTAIITLVRTDWSWNWIIWKTVLWNKPWFSLYTWSWNDLEQTDKQNWVWYHQVLVREWTNARLYINWQLNKSITIWATITNWTNLNTYWQYYSDRFNWYSEWVRIYNRTLSQQEIQNLYQEWLRQLWAWSDWILSNCLSYYNFKGDGNDIAWWYNWTISWATLTSDRFWIANSAYSFNATNTYMTATTAWYPNWSSNFSIAFSVYNWSWTNNKWSGWQYDWIMAFGNSGNANDYILWVLSWSSWNNIVCFIWDGSVTSNTWDIATTFTNWTRSHFVVVRDNTSRITVYENGTQIYQGTLTNRNNWTNNKLSLNANLSGINGTTQTKRFDYLIPFNKALSADEAKEIYNLSKLRYLYPFKKTLGQNLKSWLVLWITWDNSGTTYYDASGSWNNGTAVNTPILSRIWQNKVITFNGSNQYITFPNISWLRWFWAWIYPTANNDNILLISSWNSINIDSSSLLTVTWLTNPIFYVNWKVDNRLTLNKWQHIFVSFDSIWSSSWNIANSQFTWKMSNPMLYNTLQNIINIQQLFYSNYIQ